MKARYAWAAATLLAFGSVAFGDIRYTILDVGSLGSDKWSNAGEKGLNNAGQVAGISDVLINGNLTQQGFRTAPGHAINPSDALGSLGIASIGGDASAINNLGQVVGQSYTSQRIGHAYRTAPNAAINPATDDLGSLGGESFAFDINDSGQVVGLSYTPSGYIHAFRTGPNAAIIPSTDDLGTLGGTYSMASGVNNSGQVVGYSYLASGNMHAYRTAADRPINPATDDLGTLGGTGSYAMGISDSGQVVGYSTLASGKRHAFRTAANQPINAVTDDLGTLGGTESAAYAINSSGEVVGISRLPGDSVWAPFLYADGRMLNLNDLVPSGSGWVLSTAFDINDRGQILGQGTPPDAYFRAWLLTPTPEPTTLALLALGGLALLRRRRW